MELQFKNFIRLNDEEKYAVLELRNKPECRKNMYNDKIISVKEHFDFIENLKYKEDKIYWAIFYNKFLIGSINLVDIKNNFAEWGFYIDEKYSGFGALIEYYAMEHFLNEIGLKSVLARVFEENKKVYNMHKNKFGFFDAPLYNLAIDDKFYNALILTKENWAKNKENSAKILNKVFTVNSVKWDKLKIVETSRGGGKTNFEPIISQFCLIYKNLVLLKKNFRSLSVFTGLNSGNFVFGVNLYD